MTESQQANNDTACVVAIDVDSRQRYIFETDKLREMLGASRIIDGTRAEAEKRFGSDDNGRQPRPPHLFAPVSGEIRLWAPMADRQLLLDAAWELCEELRARGVEHTVAYLETAEGHFENTRSANDSSNSFSLKKLYEDVGTALGTVKNAKPWPDARPRCALFAPCRIHGNDPANHWNPGGTGTENEPRRELVGFRAKAKRDAWEQSRDNFYEGLLANPIRERFEDLRQRGLVASDAKIATNRPIKFRDLAEELETDRAREDQFIAFICADGDGMGNILAHLDWNAPAWGDDKKAPWQRNAQFSREVERLVRHSLGGAIAEIVLPEESNSSISAYNREALVAPAPTRLHLPLLPQLQGGEDLWIVCQRDVALELTRRFCELFQQYANAHDEYPAISRAVDVAYALACAEAAAAGRDAPPKPILTISAGVAFAKAGYPVHAMVDAAENLLKRAKSLRKGKIADRLAPEQGCIDWYWIESSLSESVEDSRRRGWEYQDGNALYVLTTRPWSSSETAACVAAARTFQKIARRKREQLESVLRLGGELSELAWTSWRQGLTKEDLEILSEVNGALPEILQLPDLDKSPWLAERSLEKLRINDVEVDREIRTPLLDLLALQHVYGLEGSAAGRKESDNA